ncbi:hypothetical protein D9M69_577530 [compost metagenome]
MLGEDHLRVIALGDEMDVEALARQALGHAGAGHHDPRVGQGPVEATETATPTGSLQVVLAGVLLIDQEA